MSEFIFDLSSISSIKAQAMYKRRRELICLLEHNSEHSVEYTTELLTIYETIDNLINTKL
jgi:hypothetical protein